MLEEIVSHKLNEVRDRKSSQYKSNLRSIIADTASPASFSKSLWSSKKGGLSLIAEIKKQSPSGGLLCDPFDPIGIARTYKEAGAAALSVLTDRRYFNGSLDIMKTVSKSVQLPVLNKEFMVDEIQFYEARAYCADAVLLIVAILERSQLIEYADLARELHLDVLVEVHDQSELSMAFEALPDIKLLGINNRNLATLSTDIETTVRLAALIPVDVQENIMIVSESGIRSREDVKKLATVGIGAMLVGESILTADDITKKVKELIDCNDAVV